MTTQLITGGAMARGEGIALAFGRPILQKVWTSGKRPYRACSDQLPWRYWDSIGQCLDYLRTKHPDLTEAGCERLGFPTPGEPPRPTGPARFGRSYRPGLDGMPVPVVEPTAHTRERG